MENINKKKMLLIMAIVLIGLLALGGTLAYLTIGANIVNGNYATNTKCFAVNYTDNTDQITGTLFPAPGPSGGLYGSVSFVRNASCGINGKGTLYLNVDSGTSSTLTNVVAPHCENKYTLETIRGLNENDCNILENARWVTNGTALKYAVYDSTSMTNLYANGYINSSFIGTDTAIHSDFSITGTSKTYYVYIWLDGYLSDDTYANLPFSASAKMLATQVDNNDPRPGDTYTTITSGTTQYNILYRSVEYIESTGTQYIDTGIIPNQDMGIYIDFMPLNNIPVSSNSVFYINCGGTSGSSRYAIGTYNSTAGGELLVNNSVSNPEMVKNTRTQLKVQNKVLTYSDLRTVNLSVNNFNANNSLYIFAAHSSPVSRFSLMKLYGLEIYDGNNLIRKYVPVRRISDDKTGLYDIVNGVFYPDAAGGTFSYE